MLVYVYTACATLGGFLFGFDVGMISGVLLLIRPHFNLSTLWSGIIVSSPIVSAAIFALIGGYVMDKSGRRKVLLWGSAMFILGGIVLSCSPNKYVFVFGRLLNGACGGFELTASTVYVAEIAPADIRGSLTCWNQLLITSGVLVAAIVSEILSAVKDIGWRYIVGFGVIPGLIQFVAVLFIPETPRWLLSHGHEHEAREVLVKLRATQDVEEEMMLIRDRIIESQKTSSISSRETVLKVLRTQHVRRAMVVVTLLFIFQQIAGINTIISYSGSILQMAGFSVGNAIWLLIIPTTVQMLASFLAIFFVDRLGRRCVLITSISGVALSLAVMAVGFMLSAFYSVPVLLREATNNTHADTCNYSTCEECTSNQYCGFCYDVITNGSCLPVDPIDSRRSMVGRCKVIDRFHFTSGYCPNQFGWIPVVGLVLYMLFFSPGLGPLPWVLTSEIFPQWARGTCSSIVSSIYWCMNLVVNLSFLTAIQTFTKYGTFWLMTSSTVICVIFVIVFLPETKNKDLEEVEQLFMTKNIPKEELHLLDNKNTTTSTLP